MNAFEAYQLFQAIKLHFNSKYDFFRYGGKTSVRVETFETRKDKYHYHKLSKQEDPKMLCVAGSIQKLGTLWVGELFDDECQNAYKEMANRRLNLKHTFIKDISRYDSYNDMFLAKKGDRAKIYKDFLRKEVSIETLAIITDIVPLWDYWEKQNGLLVSSHRQVIDKYRPFITYDKKKFCDFLVDIHGKS